MKLVSTRKGDQWIVNRGTVFDKCVELLTAENAPRYQTKRMKVAHACDATRCTDSQVWWDFVVAEFSGATSVPDRRCHLF